MSKALEASALDGTLPAGHIRERSSDSRSRTSKDIEGSASIADTEKDLEAQHARGKRAAKGSAFRDEDGVNVARAEAEFAALSREFSHMSQKTHELSRKTSRQTGKGVTMDVEKTASSGDTSEPFDLEEILRGAKALDEQTGIRSKEIGVIWDGLTVRGMGGGKTIVQTFPDSFVSMATFPLTLWKSFSRKNQGSEVEILKNFKGVVKPGEMVLVLGRPSSGCTTFLKTISNQRGDYTSFAGEVDYGRFDAATFEKRFRGEAVYNQEDDVHHAALTVGQTLGFALDLKTPGKRPAGMNKADFKKKVIETLLRMFNIQHTMNTFVGGAFIRGISGGERKRVSIAEMMTSGACVCAWDNSTRGLDASTASDYSKSLRILTNIYKHTTFVSLYQASETIYKQFDKVMVIDSGRLAFFGHANEARAYFEGLGFKEKPRQTTPDYLTGCTDMYEREYKDGFSEKNAPYDPASLAQAFLESDHHERLDAEMKAYREDIKFQEETFQEFEMAHHEAKRKHTGRSSVYNTPIYLQIWALMKRQFTSKWQDKFALSVSWATSLLIAIILGTVWYKQPQTSAGAFTRGGLIFISLLFNCFSAFGELAATMVGRPIVNKHKAYAFHRPGALWLGQIFVDLAFASVQITVFSIIVYFMCGLALNPGGFFVFILTIITGYLCMTFFFRTVGCMVSNFDIALRTAVVVLTFFVITAGYLIQYAKQQVWLRWLFYINGMGLGFSTMMLNEFSRINLTCVGSYLIPSGPGYGDINHQVCTLAGSSSGDPILTGSAYLAAQFDYLEGDMWRNYGIICVLILFFMACNLYLGEAINWAAGGRPPLAFAKETTESKPLNEALQIKKQERLTNSGEHQGSELNIASKAVLTWEHLNYDVPVPSGNLRLLNDLFGYVRPGTLTALMGASGAGKTTLLDVLASRKNIGVISGDVLVDARKPGTAFQRGTAYAEQLDVHEPTQTVREALRFSAVLRQPYDTPEEEKFAYVEEVISLLEMEDIADAIIGDPEYGLAVEQRKRVTIGVELAAKPQLLLFLDEPTSGLDSQSAFNIVRFLKKLAAAGQSILCTIHQPNSALFENFDRLFLLQKGGECVYFGEIGSDAHVLLEYLSRYGAICPSDMNPAEFMLDAIGAGTRPRLGDRDWGEIWRDSPEFEIVQEDLKRIKAERLEHGGAALKVKEQEYATPLWHQIRIVSKRANMSFWRSPNYGFTRLFNHVALAIITGLAFLQLDDSRSSLQYRVFIMFQVTVMPALILAQVEPRFEQARLIYWRESFSKAYSHLPFALAQVVAEMPYSVICAVGFFLPLYYLPGLQNAPSRAGYQFLMMLIVEVFSVTLGQMLSSLTPNSYIAMLLNPPIFVTMALFCGVTIPGPQIPTFWRSWLYQLDPFTRLIGGMVVTELGGEIVNCRPAEFNRFTAPPGQTCGEYMGPFFERGGAGYLLDNATSMCEYCAYRVGDQFFEPLGFSFQNRWRDLGVMAAFIGSNLIILFIGSRYLNFNKR